LKFVAGDTGAEDSACLEVSVGIVPHLAAAPEAESALAEGTILVGVVTPSSPATESVMARDNAAIHASPDPPSQEGTHEVTAGATEEALVRTRSLELPGAATQTPPSLELMPSAQATVPVAESTAGTNADSLLLGLVSSSGEASQGLLTTRAARSERDDDSPAPVVATKGGSSGKALVAAATSSVGSLSSASRLQQEWADTALSADVGEQLKVQGSKPTLAELDKQFTFTKGTLQNAGLQLLDAIQMTNVSTVPLASNFFC
jgi:hypothetical protein